MFSWLGMPLLLSNSKRSLFFHKGPPFVPILSQFNRLHFFAKYFYKNHINIMLPSTATFQVVAPFDVSRQKFFCLISLTHATCTSNPFLLHLVTRTVF